MRSRLGGLLIIFVLLGCTSGALAQSRAPIDLRFARAFDFTPQGDPGHSCAFSEETGGAISKASCE